MKKRRSIWFALFPVVLTTCMYVVFYSRIASKPSHAGFWLIIAMGMSIGAALTRFIQLVKELRS
jgi:hypothetical protein